MEILVLGGTRFFGVHMVNDLILKGHNVTIATKGTTPDNFGHSIERIKFNRLEPESIRNSLGNKKYDVICDSLAYCSLDVKNLLDNVQCERYVMVSTTAVYNKYIDTKEEDFNPLDSSVIWCDRTKFPYDEMKRQAERALFQSYSNQNAVSVRFPFGIGKDDYTKRLYFYIEHVVKGIPINIDNIDKQMGYVDSKEGGKFLSYLADSNFTGVINGCSKDTISLREIINYTEKKTGENIILSSDGDNAPYNGEVEYSINTDRAKDIGYEFSALKDWIYNLIDYYIEEVSST